MKKIYYHDYHKMHNQSKISIKLSPEERALLNVWSHENGWENISGFIKYRLFGYNKTSTKLRTSLKKKEKESTMIALIPIIEDLTNYYRFVLTACKKEKDRYQDINESDIIKRLQIVQRWIEKLCKRTLNVYYLLTNIANGLDINVRILTQEGLKACWFLTGHETFGSMTIFISGFVTKLCPRSSLEMGDYYLVDIYTAYEKPTKGYAEVSLFSCICKNIDPSLRLKDTVAAYGMFRPIVQTTEDGNKSIILCIYNAHITKIFFDSQTKTENNSNKDSEE